MRHAERARRLKPYIEKAAISLPDEDALEAIELYPEWKTAMAYEADIRVRYNGKLYRCLQAHTAQENWTPADAVSLWAKVLIPDPEVIADWVQPDSTNPYMKGDKVRHIGKIWISTMDYNVHEPSVAGWDIVE